MEKRFQVFISSTFSDLIAERQAVLRAILELNHMPAGMELFPSSDETAWSIIEDIIDDSDYYVLVIGGRYGSLDDAGISYTEKEYNFAISRKKRVIPVLIKDPENLPRNKTEKENAGWDKLSEFRKKVEKHHTCTYWNNADELKARVIVGLTMEIKRHPAIGWVKADKIPTDATVSEILSLRKRITELEDTLQEDLTKPPKGSEELEQGEDTYAVTSWYVARTVGDSYPFHRDVEGRIEFDLSWNKIFSKIAPEMLSESNKPNLKKKLFDLFRLYARHYAKKEQQNKGKTLRDFTFSDDDFDVVIIQLRALGLIKESKKSRSVKDNETYWTLTPYGDSVMTQLVALRKQKDETDIAEENEE